MVGHFYYSILYLYFSLNNMFYEGLFIPICRYVPYSFLMNIILYYISLFEHILMDVLFNLW